MNQRPLFVFLCRVTYVKARKLHWNTLRGDPHAVRLLMSLTRFIWRIRLSALSQLLVEEKRKEKRGTD